MRQVDDAPDDAPMETLHIYLEREQPRRSLLPVVLSVLALALAVAMLIAISILFPLQPQVTHALIRVPAVLLPPRTFTVQAQVTPTGVRTYPATTAHGVLTITNGSVIAQTIPQDFRLANVITDRAVFVPAGSANGYGFATVEAHALASGSTGNIPALAVDAVVGSSVYIRNLAAFTGGHDAYSVKYVTAHDRQTALANARQHLAVLSTGLRYPCRETIRGAVVVTWRCQFVTYHVPALYHVTGVQLFGKNLLLTVWFVARPVRRWVR